MQQGMNDQSVAEFQLTSTFQSGRFTYFDVTKRLSYLGILE